MASASRISLNERTVPEGIGFERVECQPRSALWKLPRQAQWSGWTWIRIAIRSATATGPSMNFRSRRSDDIDINVTSLIDVVLLLLIFFMVSTRFVEQSKIDLVLPSASEHQVATEPDAIEIVIDKRGQIFVNAKALVNAQLGTLQQALSEAKGQARDPMVIISADRETDFQLAVDAMDAARTVGLYRVTFPTAKRATE